MKPFDSSTTVIEFEPLEGVMLLEGGGGGLMEGQLESPGSGGTPVPQWELISVTKFVWDGWNLTAELDGEDEIVRTYAWGLDLSGSEQGAGGVGGLLFEQDGDGGPIHRVSMDGNGNVMTLRDATGALIAGYEYGPFGEALTVRGSYAGINPFRFSTKYNDSESGLYYYGYRYYSTGMGRWLSRDPIEEQDGLNMYVTVQNSLMNYVDPLGLEAYVGPEAAAIRWVPRFDLEEYTDAVANTGTSWRSDSWFMLKGFLNSADPPPPPYLSPTDGPALWGSTTHRGYLYFQPIIFCDCGSLEDVGNGKVYKLASRGSDAGYTHYRPSSLVSAAAWHPTLRGNTVQRSKTRSCVTIVAESASRVGGIGALVGRKLTGGAPPFVSTRITYRMCCNGSVTIRTEATIFPAINVYIGGRRTNARIPSTSDFIGFLFTAPSTIAPMMHIGSYNATVPPG
ncbi:MAG: RHS repeat-associated core domain-containing protein [Phycisphaeraceae bacterium]|nr:RHS repeat-associated core domain-containing protein [Phycisphaeraceae bacterium]